MIALIGIILLIGIVKKNGIMLIDFALDAERHQGMTPEQSIYQACMLRFRPILMTTMAALLGGVPLMLGTGTGSEIRQPLGYSIVGGLHPVAAADALHDAGRLSLPRPARHIPAPRTVACSAGERQRIEPHLTSKEILAMINHRLKQLFFVVLRLAPGGCSSKTVRPAIASNDNARAATAARNHARARDRTSSRSTGMFVTTLF